MFQSHTVHLTLLEQNSDGRTFFSYRPLRSSVDAAVLSVISILARRSKSLTHERVCGKYLPMLFKRKSS